MARLPTLGGDSGSWGSVLNTYLSVEHGSDGAHNFHKDFLYLPSGWNDAWESAKSAASTTPAWAMCIGDSTTQGAPPDTNFMDNTWFALMRSTLLNTYSRYGDFYPVQYSSEYYTSASSTFSGTPPWSSISSTNRFLGQAAYARVYYWTGASSGSATFTTPYACATIDIITVDYANGTWDYTVDGGSATTVTVTGAGSPYYLRRTRISGLASTTHTVVISNGSATGALMIAGCAAYTSTSAGIGFAWNAVVGASTTLWLNGTFPTDLSVNYQGKISSAATGFGFPGQPSLAIIGLGINDCQSSTVGGVAGYEGMLRRFCQAFRRGVSNCSILFLVMSNPDAVNSDQTSGHFSNSQDWHLYTSAVYRIAQMFNTGVFNVHAKWSGKPVGYGFMDAGNCHPNNSGHSDIATVLATIL